MGLSSGRGTIALALGAVLLLASCGGGDASNETGDVTVSTGASGATGATSRPSESGPTDATGKQSKKKARKGRSKSTGTGGAAPAERGLDALKEKSQREKERIKRKKKNQDETQQNGSAPATTAPPPAPKPSASPQRILYNKAKRVCETFTLDGLARKYNVEPTPEAVATAYAASYPETFRQAVHDGCKAALSA